MYIFTAIFHENHNGSIHKPNIHRQIDGHQRPPSPHSQFNQIDIMLNTFARSKNYSDPPPPPLHNNICPYTQYPNLLNLRNLQNVYCISSMDFPKQQRGNSKFPNTDLKDEPLHNFLVYYDVIPRNTDPTTSCRFLVPEKHLG